MPAIWRLSPTLTIPSKLCHLLCHKQQCIVASHTCAPTGMVTRQGTVCSPDRYLHKPHTPSQCYLLCCAYSTLLQASYL
jgi:hypothetical protein